MFVDDQFSTIPRAVKEQWRRIRKKKKKYFILTMRNDEEGEAALQKQPFLRVPALATISKGPTSAYAWLATW